MYWEGLKKDNESRDERDRQMEQQNRELRGKTNAAEKGKKEIKRTISLGEQSLGKECERGSQQGTVN